MLNRCIIRCLVPNKFENSELKTRENMRGGKIIISCFLFCRKQTHRFHSELVKTPNILTYRAIYRSWKRSKPICSIRQGSGRECIIVLMGISVFCKKKPKSIFISYTLNLKIIRSIFILKITT